MKRIRDRVGGLDVHRDSVTACARVFDGNGEVVRGLERFSTTTPGSSSSGSGCWIMACRRW